MRLWLLAGAAVLGWVGLAQAATPMVVTYPTWLRAGPSPWAKALDEVQGGWPVSVFSCSDGWCSVASDGAAGYLPEALLATGRDTPTEPRPGAECLPATHQTPERAIPLRICPAQVRSP